MYIYLDFCLKYTLIYFFLFIVDIDEILMNRSVVAVVNGEPWDMHKPLVEDCELHFLHFKDDVPDIPNQVLIRSVCWRIVGKWICTIGL